MGGIPLSARVAITTGAMMKYQIVSLMKEVPRYDILWNYRLDAARVALQMPIFINYCTQDENSEMEKLGFSGGVILPLDLYERYLITRSSDLGDFNKSTLPLFKKTNLEARFSLSYYW